ncbi:hypothetical protein HK105_205693 [Polyrhizophydium stewartii]|uniref:Uncharacterized protein n=1 Tax=Polyrhizophydium stewartii TaxID=2732419 RepID=A0ABR4N5G6_9FUNG
MPMNPLGGQSTEREQARQQRLAAERQEDMRRYLAAQAAQAHPRLRRLMARQQEPVTSLSSAQPGSSTSTQMPHMQAPMHVPTHMGIHAALPAIAPRVDPGMFAGHGALGLAPQYAAGVWQPRAALDAAMPVWAMTPQTAVPQSLNTATPLPPIGARIHHDGDAAVVGGAMAGYAGAGYTPMVPAMHGAPQMHAAAMGYAPQVQPGYPSEMYAYQQQQQQQPYRTPSEPQATRHLRGPSSGTADAPAHRHAPQRQSKESYAADLERQIAEKNMKKMQEREWRAAPAFTHGSGIPSVCFNFGVSGSASYGNGQAEARRYSPQPHTLPHQQPAASSKAQYMMELDEQVRIKREMKERERQAHAAIDQRSARTWKVARMAAVERLRRIAAQTIKWPMDGGEWFPQHQQQTTGVFGMDSTPMLNSYSESGYPPQQHQHQQQQQAYPPQQSLQQHKVQLPSLQLNPSTTAFDGQSLLEQLRATLDLGASATGRPSGGVAATLFPPSPAAAHPGAPHSSLFPPSEASISSLLSTMQQHQSQQQQHQPHPPPGPSDDSNTGSGHTFLRGLTSVDSLPQWQRDDLARKQRMQLETQDALRRQIAEKEADKARKEQQRKLDDEREQQRLIKEQEMLKERYAREQEEARRREEEARIENERQKADKMRREAERAAGDAEAARAPGARAAATAAVAAAGAAADGGGRSHRRGATSASRTSTTNKPLSSVPEAMHHGQEQMHYQQPAPPPAAARSSSPPIPAVLKKMRKAGIAPPGIDPAAPAAPQAHAARQAAINSQPATQSYASGDRALSGGGQRHAYDGGDRTGRVAHTHDAGYNDGGILLGATAADNRALLEQLSAIQRVSTAQHLDSLP